MQSFDIVLTNRMRVRTINKVKSPKSIAPSAHLAIALPAGAAMHSSSTLIGIGIVGRMSGQGGIAPIDGFARCLMITWLILMLRLLVSALGYRDADEKKITLD